MYLIAKIRQAAALHYSSCLVVKDVSKNETSYLRSCEPSCEQASSFGAFSMVLGCRVFYTGSEKQSQPISFELAHASENPNEQKNEYTRFRLSTAYVPMRHTGMFFYYFSISAALVSMPLATNIFLNSPVAQLITIVPAYVLLLLS